MFNSLFLSSPVSKMFSILFDDMFLLLLYLSFLFLFIWISRIRNVILPIFIISPSFNLYLFNFLPILFGFNKNHVLLGEETFSFSSKKYSFFTNSKFELESLLIYKRDSLFEFCDCNSFFWVSIELCLRQMKQDSLISNLLGTNDFES